VVWGSGGGVEVSWSSEAAAVVWCSVGAVVGRCVGPAAVD